MNHDRQKLRDEIHALYRTEHEAMGERGTLDRLELARRWDLTRLAADAVVVSTADAFHHGLGYGDPPEKSRHPHEGGLELARRTIEEGNEILGRGGAGSLETSFDFKSSRLLCPGLHTC